ncbi:unnamed protein product [Amoebophrya sp. A25]|nr:unnamed protein product [Amoebophrya sp. A25]|eukprot:GSA25T00024483001.1
MRPLLSPLLWLLTSKACWEVDAAKTPQKIAPPPSGLDEIGSVLLKQLSRVADEHFWKIEAAVVSGNIDARVLDLNMQHGASQAELFQRFVYLIGEKGFAKNRLEKVLAMEECLQQRTELRGHSWAEVAASERSSSTTMSTQETSTHSSGAGAFSTSTGSSGEKSKQTTRTRKRGDEARQKLKDEENQDRTLCLVKGLLDRVNEFLVNPSGLKRTELAAMKAFFLEALPWEAANIPNFSRIAYVAPAASSGETTTTASITSSPTSLSATSSSTTAAAAAVVAPVPKVKGIKIRGSPSAKAKSTSSKTSPPPKVRVPIMAIQTKLLLLFLRHGLMRGLSFDCDGTLIHSMEWYWYTWDRGFRVDVPTRNDETKILQDFEIPSQHRFTYDSFMRIYGGQAPDRILRSLVDHTTLSSRQKEAVVHYINDKNYVDIKNRLPKEYKLMPAAKSHGLDRMETKVMGTRPIEIPVVTNVARWIDTEYNAATGLDIRLAVASSSDRASLITHLSHIGLLKHLDVLVGIHKSEKHVLEVLFPESHHGHQGLQLQLQESNALSFLHKSKFNQFLQRSATQSSFLQGAMLSTVGSGAASGSSRSISTRTRSSSSASAGSSSRSGFMSSPSSSAITQGNSAVDPWNLAAASWSSLLSRFPGNVWRQVSRTPDGWALELERDHDVSKPSSELFATAAQLMGEHPKTLMGFEDAVNGIESLQGADYSLILDVTTWREHPDVRAFVFHLSAKTEENDRRELLSSVMEIIRLYDGFHVLGLVSELGRRATVAELARLENAKGVTLHNRFGKAQRLQDFFTRIVTLGPDPAAMLELPFFWFDETSSASDPHLATERERVEKAMLEASSTRSSTSTTAGPSSSTTITRGSSQRGQVDPTTRACIIEMLFRQITHDQPVDVSVHHLITAYGSGAQGAHTSCLAVDREAPAIKGKLVKVWENPNLAKWQITADKCVAFVDSDAGVRASSGAEYKKIIDLRQDQLYLSSSVGPSGATAFSSMQQSSSASSTITGSTAVVAATSCTANLAQQEEESTFSSSSIVEKNGATKLLDDLRTEVSGQLSATDKSRRVLVFDMDGTLFDSMPVYYGYMKPVLQRYQFQYPTEAEFLRELAGMTPEDIWQKILDKNSHVIIENKLIGLTAESLFEEEKKAAKSLIKQVDENASAAAAKIHSVIDKFVAARQKLPGPRAAVPSPGLAIATSSPRAKAEAHLRAHDLAQDVFEMIVGGDDPEVLFRVGQLERGKGQPVTPSEKKEILFRVAAERMRADVSQCVAFEDAIVGLEGAFRAGYPTLIDVRNDAAYPHYETFKPVFAAEYKGLVERLTRFVTQKGELEGEDSPRYRQRVKQLEGAKGMFLL